MAVRQPLEGIKVLDLSRVLAGPYCAQLLADMGADVIKVEGPDGDENRRWAPFAANGESCNFMSVNRGKRDVALDLKSPGGRSVLRGLIERADVILQSFRAGAARRLGVDYESIAKVNPRAIVCSISGYGSRGPLSELPGYDLMLQAFGGIMSLTGERGRTPVRSGVSFLDIGTGMLAYGGIVTALLARNEAEPQGQHVEVSLLETAITFLGYHGVGWLNAGVMPQPEGSGVWHLVPYQAFACADGYLLVGATNDGAWRKLCGAIGEPGLADDPRFATNDDRIRNRGALIQLLEDILRGDTMSAWTQKFTAAGVAAAPLQNLEQVLTHPQVLANDLVVQPEGGDGAVRLLGLPMKLSRTGGRADRLPPRLGEHTQSVLRDELGLSDGEIEALRREGAIA